MRKKLVSYNALFLVPRQARGHFAVFFRQRLVAQQELLYLQWIVGERFGSRVDCSQATADDDHRQSNLHIRNRVRLGCAGQLQRHEKVGRRAHASCESIRHIEHRWPACTYGKRNVVEAQTESIFGAQCAAKAHTADQCELAASLEQQTNYFEEVLVPPHRDAVFGNAAEPCHDAFVQRLI